MSTKLSPYQFFGTDASGDPLSGYQVFTYAAGSTTKQTAYQDSGGVTPHANPIILDTLGFPSAPIWMTDGEAYKLVVAGPDDTDPPTGSVRTFDNISGINDASSTLDQWVAGPAPTYVSATQFTVVGDQTGIFQVGRRLKTTNSGGTRYSTISAVAYTSLTTVSVVNDSGTLDAGLSAVFYGLLSVTNQSIPAHIRFPATQVRSTNPNTLDDYEEGTFTPVIMDQSLDTGEGQTYSSQIGTYTKIGDRVFFNGRIRITDLGTLSGSLLLSGLPFNAYDEGLQISYVPVTIAQATGLNITAGQVVTGAIEPAVNWIALELWDATTGTTGLQASELSVPTAFAFSGSYKVEN